VEASGGTTPSTCTRGLKRKWLALYIFRRLSSGESPRYATNSRGLVERGIQSRCVRFGTRKICVSTL